MSGSERGDLGHTAEAWCYGDMMKQAPVAARKMVTKGKRMRYGGLAMVTGLENNARGVCVGDAILVDGEVERVVEVINYDLVRTA